MTKPRTETSDIEARIVGGEIVVEVAAGVPGRAATIAVGEVMTSEPGGSAAVQNAGTPTAAILNFTLPRGERGPQGDQGPKGDDGAALITPILNGGFW